VRRVFVPTEGVDGDRLVLAGAEAHYVRRVLRMLPGDRFSAVLPGGVERIATVTDTSHGRVHASLGDKIQRGADPTSDVRLYPALVKAAKLELTIQKCTELGVSAVAPVVCRRSVARPTEAQADRKRDRWQRIALEAARQCGRTTYPSVRAPRDLPTTVREVGEGGGLGLVLSPDAVEPAGLGALLSEPEAPAPISLLVGPEGGLSPEELDEARAAGFREISLGHRTLRAETAAIAACALVMYELGELG
jgi:16S rRNA (uracil1498-N3)-methyltransferase